MKTVKEEDFVVFGAGLPRTGTTSLFDALEILLEGKSHNMMSFMQSTDDYELEFWTRGFHQNNLTADVSNFFRNILHKHVPSVIRSPKLTVPPVAITILLWYLFCFANFWTAGTVGWTSREKIVITTGRDWGLASWIKIVKISCPVFWWHFIFNLGLERVCRAQEFEVSCRFSSCLFLAGPFDSVS